MNQSSLKRRQAVKRAVVYTTMTMAVVISTTLLVLFTLGYRFNRENGTFSQGGLVQFISRPSGANITVGQAQLAKKTRAKITLNPGNYLVKMNIDGYQEWQKNIEVNAGKVLWLNSALFVPKEPQTTPLLSVDKLSSTAFRFDGKYLALMADSKIPEIRLLTTDGNKIAADEKLAIPPSSYTSAKKHRFTLQKWDSDSQWLLVKHVADKKTEWIAINASDVSKSMAIKPKDKAQPIDILFDPRGNDRLIVLYSDGMVRFVNLSSGEITNSGITNAADISLGGTRMVIYTTIPQKGEKTRSVSYLTLGAKVPREIGAYVNDNPLSAGAGDYFGASYLAVTYGKTVKISKVSSWPSSDSEAPFSSEVVATIALSESGKFTSFHGQGRFVASQQGTIQTVYDLELGQQYSVPIVGVKKALDEKISWSEIFHFWDDATGYYRQYEFDGTNQSDIVKVRPGFDAAYDDGLKYLYSIGESKDGSVVQVTKMTTS